MNRTQAFTVSAALYLLTAAAWPAQMTQVVVSDEGFLKYVVLEGNGAVCQVSCDGQVLRMQPVGGLQLEYNSAGQVRKIDDQWLEYDSNGRVRKVSGIWIEYKSDSRVSKIDSSYFTYDGGKLSRTSTELPYLVMSGRRSAGASNTASGPRQQTANTGPSWSSQMMNASSGSERMKTMQQSNNDWMAKTQADQRDFMQDHQQRFEEQTRQSQQWSRPYNNGNAGDGLSFSNGNSNFNLSLPGSSGGGGGTVKTSQSAGGFELPPAAAAPAPVAAVPQVVAAQPVAQVASAGPSGVAIQRDKVVGTCIEGINVAGSGATTVVNVQVGSGGQNLPGPFALRLMIRDDDSQPWRVVRLWNDLSLLTPGNSAVRSHSANSDLATASAFAPGKCVRAVLADASGKIVSSLQGKLP